MNQEIIIITEGADTLNPDATQGCCWGPFFAFRG